jgi:2-amino-4-hydroxy-6-hydroxymethyldihydropteridine diphosphokinase
VKKGKGEKVKKQRFDGRRGDQRMACELFLLFPFFTFSLFPVRYFFTFSLFHSFPPSLTTFAVSFINEGTTLVDNEFTTVFVSLGSNLGDRAGNLLLAVRGLMEASFVVHKLSAIYETEPVGIDTEYKFLNMVAEIRVNNVSPSQMMARLLRIEYLLGRREKSLKRPRTVDLDILFFGEEQIDTEFLTIPHPRLHLRNFVLNPLAEIAPNFVHPTMRKEVADLLAESEDQSKVDRWNPNRSLHPELAAKR